MKKFTCEQCLLNMAIYGCLTRTGPAPVDGPLAGQDVRRCKMQRVGSQSLYWRECTAWRCPLDMTRRPLSMALREYSFGDQDSLKVALAIYALNLPQKDNEK